jgi:Zn-dependent alcohol dehydrogenase
MRAAVLHRPGTPLELEDVTLDDPQAGEVRVRLSAVGVCHSDYHYMVGDIPCPLPIVLGHEGTGEVVAVGSGVTRVAPGDSVVLTWRPRCGQCRFCSSGRPALCQSGRRAVQSGGLLDGTTRLHLDGAPLRHFLGASCLAEECVVAEQSIVAIPSTVPPRIAAILGCAVITGVGAVLNVLQNPAGSSVLVLGAGGVGLSCVMGAKLVGADPIIVADVEANKLALAAELGATHCLDASQDSVVEAVNAICDGGVDWALEAIGLSQTVEQAIACVRTGGTAVAMGLAKPETTFSVRSNALVQGEKQIRGSLYGSANLPVDVPRILHLYESGRLPLDKLLGRSYPLEGVNDAYGDLVAGAVGRSIILPNGEPDHPAWRGNEGDD